MKANATTIKVNEIKGSSIIGGTLFHFARKADAIKFHNKVRKHGILLIADDDYTRSIYRFDNIKDDHKQSVLNVCKKAFEESLR